MNPKTRMNPAFAGPHQRMLRLGSSPGGYWASVKDDHWPDDLRYWLDPLTAPWAFMPDASWLAIPIAMSRDPLRRDGDPWCITKLAKMDPEEIYPTKRNGILHRWAAEHLRNLAAIARDLKISPHQLPMSTEEAHRMDLELDHVAWPWLRDHRMLDEIEKSVRMHIYNSGPVIAKGRQIEVDFLDANTRAYLETGYHAVDGPHEYAIPHRVDLQREADKAADPFFEFWWDDLRESLVLPAWSIWEEKEAPYLVDSSQSGFFTDAPGWNMDEVGELHTAVQMRMYEEEYGHDPWNPPVSTKIISAVDRLLGFVRPAKRSENHTLAHA